MALGGGFAAGLAGGLRNGFALNEAYERGRAIREQEKRSKEIQAAIAQGAGLTPVPVAPDAQAGAVTTGDTGGLQPIRMNGGGQPAAADVAEPADAIAAQAQPVQASLPAHAVPIGIAESGGPAPRSTGLMDTVATAQSGAPGSRAMASAGGFQGDSSAAPYGVAARVRPAAARSVDPLGGGEFGALADGLTRGYRKALELGDAGTAMQLLLQREKLVGQHREQAYGDALNRYQLTGDPNAFVPLVNRFGPNGIHVNGIETLPQKAGGQPLYMLHYADPRTGKDVSEPLSQGKMQSIIQGIADPAAQRALIAQQAQGLYQLEVERRKRQLATDARVEEVSRTEPIRTAARIQEIQAQGDEARRTAVATAKVGNKSSTPAEVATANWLLDNGVAKDAGDAWDLVRGARTKSRQDFALAMSKELLKAQDPLAAPEAKLTAKQAFQQGLELYDSLNGTQSSAGPEKLPPPAVGTVENGWRFKGGDPADKANWEQQ